MKQHGVPATDVQITSTDPASGTAVEVSNFVSGTTDAFKFAAVSPYFNSTAVVALPAGTVVGALDTTITAAGTGIVNYGIGGYLLVYPFIYQQVFAAVTVS